MYKKITIFLAGLAILISACGGKAPAATSAAATPSLPVSSATATPLLAECTVVSLMPTPGPTDVSLFPSATEEDWVRGPADAAVTFLEYSDFQ